MIIHYYDLKIIFENFDLIKPLRFKKIGRFLRKQGTNKEDTLYVSMLAIIWFDNHSRNSSTEPLPTPESPMLPYLFKFLKTCGMPST